MLINELNLEVGVKDLLSGELEARLRVRGERFFYQETRVAVAVNLFFFIVWALAGFGQCWPLWVSFGWGGSLLWRGVRLGILDAAWLEQVFGIRLQRFTDHWEDEKVKAILERAENKKIETSKSDKPSKSPKKKSDTRKNADS